MIYQNYLKKRIAAIFTKKLNLKWTVQANVSPDEIAYRGKYTVFYQTNSGNLVWAVNGTEYTVNSYSAYGVAKDQLNHTGLFVTEEYAKDIGVSRAKAAQKLDKEFKKILKDSREFTAVSWMQKLIKKYEQRFLTSIYCRGRISGNGLKMSYWDEKEKVLPVLTNHIKFFMDKGLLKQNARIYCAGEEVNYSAGEMLAEISNMDIEEKDSVSDFIRSNILRNVR